MTRQHIAKYIASAIIVASVIVSSPSLGSEVRGAFLSTSEYATASDSTADTAVTLNTPSIYATAISPDKEGLTALPFAQ